MNTVYNGDQPFIFVSYAHKDASEVLPAIEGLTSRGYRIWYDAATRAGTEWPTDIARHLVQSTCVLVFLSNNSIASPNCRQELTMAINRGKHPVIVFLEEVTWDLDNCGTEMQVGTLHHLYRWRHDSAESFLDALAEAEQLRPCRGDGETAPETPPLSAEWFKKGLACYRGEGVAQDFREAVTYFTKAADAGLADAQYYLAVCLETGKGTPLNYAEAARYYLLAAQQGHAWAQNNLYFLFRDGRGVPRDTKQAMSWLRKAAQQNDPDALYNLGFNLLRTSHAPENHAKALQYLTQAANRGHITAMRELGLCYLHGIGTEQDLSQAKIWLQAAADQGDSYAPDNLRALEYKELINRVLGHSPSPGKE